MPGVNLVLVTGYCNVPPTHGEVYYPEHMREFEWGKNNRLLSCENENLLNTN